MKEILPGIFLMELANWHLLSFTCHLILEIWYLLCDTFYLILANVYFLFENKISILRLTTARQNCYWGGLKYFFIKLNPSQDGLSELLILIGGFQYTIPSRHKWRVRFQEMSPIASKLLTLGPKQNQDFLRKFDRTGGFAHPHQEQG